MAWSSSNRPVEAILPCKAAWRSPAFSALTISARTESVKALRNRMISSLSRKAITPFNLSIRPFRNSFPVAGATVLCSDMAYSIKKGGRLTFPQYITNCYKLLVVNCLGHAEAGILADIDFVEHLFRTPARE